MNEGTCVVSLPFSEMGKETSKGEPGKSRGSYRTHRRNLAQKRNNQELKELREILKWGPQPFAPIQSNALITGYPDPGEVPISTADMVDRATRDLKERNRQLECHISQLKAEAKDQAYKRSMDKKIIGLLSKETVRLQDQLKAEKAGKASTTGSS